MQSRLTRALSWVAAGQLLFLALTGIYLYFNYVPSKRWFDLPPGTNSRVRLEAALRDLHRADAWLVLLTLLALAIVLMVEHHHRVEAWSISLAGAVASFTGFLLPWDQLALWAVVVGTDIKGMSAAWSGQIRFVIIGGAEVAPSTVQHWFWVHVVVAALALVGVAHLLVPRRVR